MRPTATLASIRRWRLRLSLSRRPRVPSVGLRSVSLPPRDAMLCHANERDAPAVADAPSDGDAAGAAATWLRARRTQTHRAGRPGQVAAEAEASTLLSPPRLVVARRSMARARSGDARGTGCRSLVSFVHRIAVVYSTVQYREEEISLSLSESGESVWASGARRTAQPQLSMCRTERNQRRMTEPLCLLRHQPAGPRISRGRMGRERPARPRTVSCLLRTAMASLEHPAARTNMGGFSFFPLPQSPRPTTYEHTRPRRRRRRRRLKIRTLTLMI
jgi:hypothetical protein